MGSGHLRHSSASRRFQTGFALTSRSRSNLYRKKKETNHQSFFRVIKKDVWGFTFA